MTILLNTEQTSIVILTFNTCDLCMAMSSGFDVPVGSTVLTKSRKTAVFYHKIHGIMTER